MEVIDKERKNALLSIYSGYEPQPEPQQNHSPNRNHNHQFQLWTPKYGFGFGFGFSSYLDRACHSNSLEISKIIKQYTVHFVYT
jgi:hypothetical protein